MPESTRNGFTRTVRATPERKTATVVSGTAIRKMRTCLLWRTAARKARSLSARPNRARTRGPSWLTSDTAVKEFIPEPPSAQENQAAPLDISLFWAPHGRSQIWPGRGTAGRGTAAHDQGGGPGRKTGYIEGDSADKLLNSYDSPGRGILGMGKNVLGGPAGEVKPYPVRQEAKTGRREVRAPLAEEDDVELFLERVQVQHIGRRVGELRVGQRLGAPIGELLLLGEVDAQHFAHEVLETVLVGVSARDARGDLGAIDGGSHDS